jgi:hypothetical protein
MRRRESMDKEKAAPLADERIQPLQLMDIEDYEKLMGLVEAGDDLPEMLAHKVNGRIASATSPPGCTHRARRRTRRDCRCWKGAGRRWRSASRSSKESQTLVRAAPATTAWKLPPDGGA